MWVNNFVPGNYLLAKASDVTKGHRLRIRSDKKSVHKNFCISFYYCMFGEDIKSLELYAVIDFLEHRSALVWKANGNQGKGWKYKQFGHSKTDASILANHDGDFHVRNYVLLLLLFLFINYKYLNSVESITMSSLHSKNMHL